MKTKKTQGKPQAGVVGDAKAPKNMTELRNDMLDLYADIGTGDVDLAVAKEKCNAAGKIIKSAAVQLEYAVSRRAKPNIPFMK